MADITAEQVARAIKCVEHATGEPELVAALTRWRDELVAAERPDDTALIAAEAERARPAIDPLAYTDSPAWDEPPVRKPAPEVVDVPQPEPWHVRLVRLAQEAQAASKACAAAEAAFTRADAERETARKERAAAREVCHAKRQALTEATAAAAIIRDAQTGGAS